MDRKAWTIILLCIAGMAVNWHYANKNAEAAKRIAAEKAALAPAAFPADPAEALPRAPDPAPQTELSTQQSSNSQPEQTASLKRGTVVYEFTTLGGGIKTALLEEHEGVVINQHSSSTNRHEPVGALRRNPGALDALNYVISAQTDDSITFAATAPDGLEVSKTFSFSEGDGADDHLLNLEVTLTNTGSIPFQSRELYLYAGTSSSLTPDELLKPGFFWNNAGDADSKDSDYFKGGWFSDAKNEYRQSFDALRFGGVMSRFFVNIISHDSPNDQPATMWANRFRIDHSSDDFKNLKGSNEDFAVEGAVSLPPLDLAAGAAQTENYQIYLGPKEYHRLKATGEQRQFVMFYGWFSIISRTLTTIMNWLHDRTGNWGIAIILMTLIIRTVMWPLQAKSQYQMKRMGLLGPKMKEMQEKYKDDPQKQQAEMMKMYRDYGVNPLGGCLPMFLQIPIFFGFYRVLQYAAELRGQDFLWVTDLSLPDTVTQIAGFDVNPLPILMGVSMFLQMKVAPQPATADKMQQRIFMLMPFMFLFFCYNFASALALYWTTQNVFSIFQTWIMKLYLPEPTLEKIQRPAKSKAASPSLFQTGTAGRKDTKDKKNRPPRLGG